MLPTRRATALQVCLLLPVNPPGESANVFLVTSALPGLHNPKRVHVDFAKLQFTFELPSLWPSAGSHSKQTHSVFEP